MSQRICRIAVFYDGTYFSKVSNYYAFQHERQARISIKGLHEFISAEVARSEGIDARQCQIVDASYFRGRLSAQQAFDQNKLYSERVFEDVLMRADITLYQTPVVTQDGKHQEKGIDVWLALEAYEMASLKRYDVCVLITGDGDFVPLVRKLNTLGSRVMLLGWDFEYEREGKQVTTRVATGLIEHVNYPVMMDKLIDARERRTDPMVNNLFIPKTAEPQARPSVIPVVAVTTDAQDGQEREGTLHSLVLDKGFGFIRPAGGGDNVFFHKSELTIGALADLPAQAPLRFTLVKTDRGLVARNVRPIQDLQGGV
ncbi:NYN domain-containing protein [Inhella sp.]|uniref:NYN domain-containing protein n=1 Tax=Inhella sp. TaxID=1921806 RepID=UPI0035B327A7